VHAAAGIRPDLGSGHGKGEAIWKSLFVTSGDLLVFLDADVTNVTPSFVTTLLEPLVQDEGICLVKAFYDRDLAGEDWVQHGQGGRVTELVARPAIALWWPELAGIAQPLAGEWAIRRSLLEQCALPCGYGVEMAVLIDTYERLGIDAIAQVDLGHREHRHQDLQSLGAMSVEILAALAERLPPGDPTPPMSIAQPMRAGGAPGWSNRAVNVDQRPPAASVASAPTTG
jgi:glucosyl-3-phosphoglycerate synthase